MNKQTIGACGLFCEACDIYQSVQTGNLKTLAREWNMDPDDLVCDGCRSDRRSVFCNDCVMRECCLGRNLDNCSECEEFPCKTLVQFNNDEAPHHFLAIDNCRSYREKGGFEWHHTQKEQWTCSCGQMFSWYQEKCLRCGKKVSNIIRQGESA